MFTKLRQFLTNCKIINIYNDQRFRIIEIKKSVESQNPIMPCLTKTKESVSSTSVLSESKDAKSRFLNNSGKSTPLKTKYSTKGSDRSGILSISRDLSSDRTSYLIVVERRKIANVAKVLVLTCGISNKFRIKG